MAQRGRLVDDLRDARSALLRQADRQRVAADVIGQIILRPHSQHEYLSARLEVAHVHMVGRDIAERAILAAFDAPRAPKADAEEARSLLGHLLLEHGWHRGALDRVLVDVVNEQDQARRRARRAATPAAHVASTVATVPGARSSGRSLA